ncbi:winged helix-turn-helix domain-containing protein [Pseudomonas sp. SJZ131]|uniref:ATP-binding protein n=1 Tax=Pseudomonas sp. SJZ131 TaxID=2572895 RepID=UPI00119B669B|nr:winged helix-turn-helix domain-containing protein [Pseudomonas sp. SJZ131]TWD50337.1 putative ATPase [Pseudomonas sp. SJZ131]
MNSPTEFTGETLLRFGPYVFHPSQRLILDGDRPLRMGGRALDILQVLLEHAGEVVSKDDLIARVWPTSVVEEINLRVHIAALRRALGDGENGQRYIVNIPQRGYSIIAPVQRVLDATPLHLDSTQPPQHNLPARLSPVTGRDSMVGGVVRQLPLRRFMTLVGPAGIGKTTVAMRVAELLLQHYRDGVWLVDLASVDAPAQLHQHLRHALPFAADLSCRHALLVLDNCEHLRAGCRTFIEQLLASAPRLSILATSREPLQARDETVQRVPPLEVPPVSALHSVAQAMGYSAVQLLVSRARTRQQGFVLREQDLRAVRDICRRLDGLPLTIELAAAQIGALGLVGLQAQLDNCLQLLTQGRRTAVARHQSLRAALDWSYQSLSAQEQKVLCHLATFKSAFTVEAASGVICASVLAPIQLSSMLEKLARTSLLSVELVNGVSRYRWLNTTRAYALEKLADSGQQRAIELSHAQYLSRARMISGVQLSAELVE